MARRRFFVDEIRKGEAEISGEEAKHLTRVLRVEVGQKFEISDGVDIYLAEVKTAHKGLVEFRVLEKVEPDPEIVHVTLLASLIKFDRFELLIEKATELGVAEIIPVLAARTEAGLEKAVEKRIERWRRIALEAGQQSRRDRLPQLGLPISFEDALRHEARWRFWLDEEIEAAAPIFTAIPAGRARGDSVAVLIGPEGGWTQPERAAAADWTRVSLGHQILRAETAAIAALAIIAAAWATPGQSNLSGISIPVSDSETA